MAALISASSPADQPNRLDPVITEQRLTRLEDFMAEVRRNTERSQSYQLAMVAGVGSLLVEMLVRLIKKNS